MIRHITILLMLIIILFSCHDFSSKDKSSHKTFISINTKNEIGTLHTAKKIDDVNTLIALLNDSSDLEAEQIGFTGKPSKSYKYFERLTEIAKDSTLLRLTYHTNPKLRIYGMWALANKNKELALEQIKRLKKDKTSVIYYSGCIKMDLPLSYLALAHFDSSDMKIKFTSNKGYLNIDVE